ncbi:zinc dependent phospholipase C family protein [Paenibacillus koleovorans]|uniref:zinc dependent phospholipase C family protein n=1 Tax=Paenibacillus koleovorans TaxID=121608 RepID=UPI000FD84DC8|nr:zinc dependent phospholipase C family protein [Paenibacillus koleovorans]
MPNIWTHFLFGEQLLQQVAPDVAVELSDRKLRNLFRVGCQGPDLLFYHRFLPLQRGLGMPALGGAMHSSQCGPVLSYMVRSVTGRPATDPALIYVLGFLTHHVLDRNMHPYVFYRSGFRKWDHQRFEILMDTLIVRQRLGLETWRTPVWRELDAGPRLPESVTSLLLAVTGHYFPTLAEPLGAQDWNDAYRDMLRGQRLFHDPYGWKRALTGGYIRKLVAEKNPPAIDIMNEARAVWHHPAVPEETFTESVWDMWELALEDGSRLLEAAMRCVRASAPQEKEQGWQSFIPALGNISYETGKPCDSGLEVWFVDPVF